MVDKQAFATDVAKRVVNLAQKQIKLDEQEHEKAQGDTADTTQLETRRTSIKNFEDLVGDEDITKQAVHLAKLEMVAVSIGSDGDGDSAGGGGKGKGKAKKGKKGKKSNGTLDEMVKRSLFAAGIAKNVIKLAQMQVSSNETGTQLLQDTSNQESDEGVSPQEESVISDILSGIRTLKRRKQVKVEFDTSWDKNGNLAPLSDDRERKHSKEERTIIVPTVDNRYMKSRGLDLTEQSVELKFRPSLKELTPESDYSGEYDAAPMEIETRAYSTSRRKSIVDEIPDSVQYQIYRRISLQDPTFAATLRELRESASSDNDSDNKDDIDRIIDLLPHVDLRMIHRKYFHQQDQVVPTMRPVHSHTLRLDGTYNEEEEMETEDVSLDEEKADEISRLVYNLCRRYSLHEVENLQLYKRMSIIPGASPLSLEITPDMACFTAHPDTDEEDFARPEQEESSISMTLDPTPTVILPAQNIETQFGDSENRYRTFLLESDPGQVAAETGFAVTGEVEYKAVDPGAGGVTLLSQQTETIEFQSQSAPADAPGDSKLKYSATGAGSGEETVKPIQQMEILDFQLESAPADVEGDIKLRYSAIDAGSGDETMEPIQQTRTLEFQSESAPADAQGDTKLKYSAIGAGSGEETVKPIQQMEILDFQLESAPADVEGDIKLRYSAIDAGSGDETMKPIQQTEILDFQLESAPADVEGDIKLGYSATDAGSGDETMKPIQQTRTFEFQSESAPADVEGDTFNSTIKYPAIDPGTGDETMKPNQQIETIPYCFEDAQVVSEGDSLDHRVKYPSIDPGTGDESDETMKSHQEVVTEPYGFECVQEMSEKDVMLKQPKQFKAVEPGIGAEMAIDQDLETLKYEVDSTQIDTSGDTLTQLVPEQSQGGHEPSPARSDDDFVFVHQNADQQVPIAHSSSGSSGDADFVMVPEAEERRNQQKKETYLSQSLSDEQMIVEPQMELAEGELQEAPPLELVAMDEKSLEVPEASERINQTLPPQGASLEQTSVAEPVTEFIQGDSELPPALLDQGVVELFLPDADSHRVIDEASIADVPNSEGTHEDADVDEYIEVGEKTTFSSESSIEFEFEDAPESESDFERNVMDEEGPVEQTVSDVVSQLPKEFTEVDQNLSGESINSKSPPATIETRRLEVDTTELTPQKERAEEDVGPPRKKLATADLREHSPEAEDAAERGLQVQMATTEETIGVPAQSTVEFIAPELNQGVEDGKCMDKLITDLHDDTADDGNVAALTTDMDTETDIQEQSPAADVVACQVDNSLELSPLEMGHTVEEGGAVAAKQPELTADIEGGHQLGVRLPTNLDDEGLVEQAVGDVASQQHLEFIGAEPDLSEQAIELTSPAIEIETRRQEVDTIEMIPQEKCAGEYIGLPETKQATDDLLERGPGTEEATERSLQVQTAATEDTIGVPIQSTVEFIPPELNHNIEDGKSLDKLVTDLDEDVDTLTPDLNAETGIHETSPAADVVASPIVNTLELGPQEVSCTVEEGGKIEVTQPKLTTDLDADTTGEVGLTTDSDEDFPEQDPADPKMVTAPGESTIELVPFGLKQALDEDGRLQDKLVTDLDSDISEDVDDEDGRILRTDRDEASDIQEQGPGAMEGASPNISTTIQIISPEPDGVSKLIDEPLGGTKKMVTDLDDDTDGDVIGLLNPVLSKSTETLTTDLDADSSDDDDYALPSEESILMSQDAGNEQHIIRSLEVHKYTSEEAVCVPDVVGTVLEVRTMATGPVTEEQVSKETVRISEAEVITVATTTTVTEATSASITYEGENIPDALNSVLEVPFLDEGPDTIDLIDQTVATQEESCDPVLSDESLSPDFVCQCPFTEAAASSPFGTPLTTIFFRTHYTNHREGECVALAWNREGSKETELCQSCMGEEIPTKSGFWYMFSRLPAGSKIKWKLVLFNTDTGSLIRCEERPNRTLVVPNVYTLIDALWAFDDTQIDVHDCDRQLESIPFSYDVLREFSDSSEEGPIKLESICEEKEELNVERQDSSANFDSIEAYSESLEEDIMSDATFLAEQLSQFIPGASGELQEVEEEIDLTENQVAESMPLALDGEEQDDRISAPTGVTQIPSDTIATVIASDGALVPHMTDVFFRTHYLVHSDDEYVAVIGDSEYLGNWNVHTSIGEELPKGSGFWYVYCKLPAGLKINWKLIVFDRRQGHFLRFEERPNRHLLIPSKPIMVDVLWAYYGETPIEVHPEENDLESIPFSFEVDVPEAYRDRRMALFGKALNFPAKALKYDSMRVAQPDEIVPEQLAALAKEVLSDDVVREEPTGEDKGEDVARPTRRVSRIHKAPFDIQLALVPYMTDVFIRTHYLVHSDDEYVAVIGDSDFLGNWKIHTSFGEELPKGSGFWYVYCKLPAGLGINWKLIVFNRREGRFLRFEERPNRALVVPSHPIMIDALWAFGQTPIEVHPDETELESIPFSYPVKVPEAYRKRRAAFAGVATNLPPIALKYESLKVLIDTGPIPDNLGALAKEVLSEDSNKENVDGTSHEPDNKSVRERRVSIVHDITLGFERQIDILNEPNDKEIEEMDTDATVQAKQQGLELPETKACTESILAFSQTLQDVITTDAEAFMENLRQTPSDAVETPRDVEEQSEMAEQQVEQSIPSLLEENGKEIGDSLAQTASEADATDTNYGALVPYMTDVFFRTHHLVNSNDEYVAVIGDSKYLGNWEVHTRIGEELPKGSGFWYVYCRLPAGLKINWKLIVFDRKQGRFLHFEERPNRKLVIPSHPIMVDVLWGYGQTPIEVHPDEIKLECIPFSYVVDVPEDYRNRRIELFGDSLNIPAIALKYESLRVAHEDEEVPAALAKEVLSDDVPTEECPDANQTSDEQVPVRPVTLVHEAPFEIKGALVPYMTDVFFRTHRLVDADYEHVAVIGEAELLGDRKVHTSIGEELPKGSGFWYVYCKLPAGSKLNWKLIVFDPGQGRFLHFEDRPNRKLTVPCHPIMVDALWSYGQTPIEVYPDEKELESIPFSYIVDVPEAYRNRRAASFADALDSPAIALKFESLRVSHDEEDMPENLAALAEEVLEGDVGGEDGADYSEMLGEPVPDRRVSIAQDVPFEIQGALVPYMTDVFFRTHYLVNSDDEQIAVIGDSEFLGNWKVHTGIGEELPKGSGFWYVYCKLPAGLEINWKLIVFDRRQRLFLRFEERPNRKLTIPSNPLMVDALWAYGQTPINVHPDEKELESIPFSYSVNVPEAYRKRRRELYADEEPNTAIALKYESLKLDHGDEEIPGNLEALAKEVLSTEDKTSPAEVATQEISPPVILTVPERRVSLINQVPFRLGETTNPCVDEEAQKYMTLADNGSERFAEVLSPEEVEPCHPSPPQMIVDPTANIIITTQQKHEEVAATRLDTVPFEQGMAFETSGDVIQNASQTPNIGEHVEMELQAALSHEITTVEKTAVDYTNTDLTPQDPMKTVYISRQEDVELEEPMTAAELKKDHTVPTPKEYRVVEAPAPGHQELIESFNDSSGSGLQVNIQPIDVFEEQRECVSQTTEKTIISEGLGPIEQLTEMVTGITLITELQSAQTSEEVVSIDPESTETADVLIIEEPRRKISSTEPRQLVAVDLQQESCQGIEESIVMESAESQEAGVPFSVHPDTEHSVAISETSLMTEGTTENMVSIADMQTEVPGRTMDSYHGVAIQESALPSEGVQPYDVDNVQSIGDVPQVTLQTTEIQIVVGSEEVGPMEPEHALNVTEEKALAIERKVSITAPRPTMEIDPVSHEVTEMEISNIGVSEIQDIGYSVEGTTGHIVALSEKSEGAEETVPLEVELTLNLEGVELATQVEEKISVTAQRPLAEIDPVSHDVTEFDTAHMETPEVQVIAYDTVPMEGQVVALTEKAIGVEAAVPYDADHVERLGDVPEVTLQTTEIQVVVGSEEVDPMDPEQALNVPEEKGFVVERKISVTSPRPLTEIDLLSHDDRGTEAGQIPEIESEIAGYRMEVFAEHTAALQEATVPTEGMSEDTQHVSELEIPPTISIQMTEREAAVVMDSRATEGVSELMEEATMEIANVNEEPCTAIEGAGGRDRPITEIMAVESDTQREVTSTFTGELHTEEVVINIQSTGENVVILQEEINIPEESSLAAEPVEVHKSIGEVIIDPENTALNVKNVTVVEKAPFIQVELAVTAPESTIEVTTQQENTVKKRPISQAELQLEISEQSSTEDICVTPLGRATQEEMGEQQQTITTEIAMPVETVHESSQIKMELSQATMEVEGIEGQLTAITQKTIPEEDVAVDSPDLDSVALISDYATIEMQQRVTKEIAVVEKTVFAENAAGLPDDMKEGNISELNTIIRTYMSGLDADDRLGVTGDLPELGNWKTIKHFAVENPPGSGLWYIHLSLPRGVSFWWKLVQGSPDGSEIRKWEDRADRQYIVPKTGDSLIDVLWSSEEKVIALSDVTTEMTEIPFDYGEVRINTDNGIVGVTKVDGLMNGVESKVDTSVPSFEYRLPEPNEDVNVNVRVDVKQPLPRDYSWEYGSEASMQTAHESVEDFDDERGETKNKLGNNETTLDFDNEVTAEVRERELLWVLKSQSEIQVCIGPRRGRDGDGQASVQSTQNVQTNGRTTNGVASAIERFTGVQDLEPGELEDLAADRTSTRTWFRTHRFVGEGLCVGVTGSLQELGAWDPSAAVLGVEHPVGSGFWYIDSSIRVGEEFKWKLALIDRRTKVVKEEEDRDRREHCITSRPVLIDTIWNGIDRVNLVEDVADESDLEKIPPLSEDTNLYKKKIKHIHEQLSKYHLCIDIERVSEGTGDQDINEEEKEGPELPYSEFSRGIHVSSSECDFEISPAGQVGLVKDAVVPPEEDRQMNEMSRKAASRLNASDTALELSASGRQHSFPPTHKLNPPFCSQLVQVTPHSPSLILSVTSERLRDETVCKSLDVCFIDYEQCPGAISPSSVTRNDLDEEKDLPYYDGSYLEYDSGKPSESYDLEHSEAYVMDYESQKPTPFRKYASDADVRRENTCSSYSLSLPDAETREHSSLSSQSLMVTFDDNGRLLSCSDINYSEESVCFVSYEVHKMNVLNRLADNDKASSCPLIYEIGDEFGLAKTAVRRNESRNEEELSEPCRNRVGDQQAPNVEDARVCVGKRGWSSSSDDVFYDRYPGEFSREYSNSTATSVTIEPEADMTRNEEICFISYSDSDNLESVGSISGEIGKERHENGAVVEVRFLHETQDLELDSTLDGTGTLDRGYSTAKKTMEYGQGESVFVITYADQNKEKDTEVAITGPSKSGQDRKRAYNLADSKDGEEICFITYEKDLKNSVSKLQTNKGTVNKEDDVCFINIEEDLKYSRSKLQTNESNANKEKVDCIISYAEQTTKFSDDKEQSHDPDCERKSSKDLKNETNEALTLLSTGFLGDDYNRNTKGAGDTKVYFISYDDEQNEQKSDTSMVSGDGNSDK
ncbi:uncharacterized protein LOC135485425 [Lineus longissimus]|uniref:uncharacterized protein LOC135485425 n=1 Tax=Lineus longissimus TaxID=88925 RepID=UPI00315C7844